VGPAKKKPRDSFKSRGFFFGAGDLNQLLALFIDGLRRPRLVSQSLSGFPLWSEVVTSGLYFRHLFET
jgi:hypothetical protein